MKTIKKFLSTFIAIDIPILIALRLAA